MLGWRVLLQLLELLELLVFARAILSWFVAPASRNPLIVFIRTVTDPIINPIRAIMPRTGPFDFSAMIAIVLLSVLQGVVENMIS